MRFEDEIYFSKNHNWSSIDIGKPTELVDKFEDRIRTLYLDQAYTLLADKNMFYNSFSIGVILFCAIEWLGTFLTQQKGFKNKLDEFLKHSNEFLALSEDEKIFVSKKITECFRNGVIHNGRVKESCQFDYYFDEKLFAIHNDLLIINSKPLYGLVEEVVSKYIDKLRKDDNEMSKFIHQFKIEFDSELKKLI